MFQARIPRCHFLQCLASFVYFYFLLFLFVNRPQLKINANIHKNILVSSLLSSFKINPILLYELKTKIVFDLKIYEI